MRLLLVSGNEGKFREFREALGRRGHRLEWKRFPYPEVQSASLDEVVGEALAWLRARLGESEPFMIDDSGLFVPALNDFPGVFSAYVLRTVGNPGMLRLMEGVGDRRARFEARLGLWSRETGQRIFPGRVDGRIGTEARGAGGFGFDPIFVPEGRDRTFAEISVEEKNSFSHRGRAVAALLDFLEGRAGR
ncbi:MAG: RdgB/HAM1 family non-canonical purine NTP pyrophosphatase [Euryarchaeota archaeon]|nr:RdgB/HAM1 family non-canonical purine NTP pyrophosphatase [Euryarchaeota archaeon]